MLMPLGCRIDWEALTAAHKDGSFTNHVWQGAQGSGSGTPRVLERTPGSLGLLRCSCCGDGSNSANSNDLGEGSLRCALRRPAHWACCACATWGRASASGAQRCQRLRR